MQVGMRSIASIADEWDRLADEVGATPFVRPGWIAAWWRAFGRGSLHVLTAERGGALTGIVPVILDGSNLRSPTNSATPLFGFVTADDGSARHLAAAVLSAGVRRIDLSCFSPSDSGFRSLVDEARANRFRTITRPVALSPFLSTDGDWQDYEATIGAKVRSEVRRRRRRLEELGDVNLEVADGSERLETLLLEGFRVEELGWKGDYGSAINSDPRTRRFYRDVARWAGNRGWLRLGFLRLDGRPIAFDLSLETDGIHFLLKTGFDHDFGRFGPGTILRSMMLERAFTGPIVAYELLGTLIGTNNRWKLDWTDRYHERMRFQAFPPSLARSLEWPAFKYGPVVSERARAFAGRMLGASGRDLVKRGRRVLRGLHSR
jgi:CelD/BcsL family acetyltransferase involved in cellulose biosynthesis